MSADLMLTSKDANFETNSEKCVFVDELSMGESHYEFSRLLRSAGEINDSLIEDVKRWNESLTKHPNMEIEKVVKWLQDHKGEYVSTEGW